MTTDTITKTEIVEKLEGDWKFVERALLFIADRQTDIERLTKSTLYKNYRGLSVPLARIGTDLAETLRTDGLFSWQDISNAIEVCAYHWRQSGMLMLMEQGFTMEEAAYMLYPIKTPRRAPRPARGREERLVNYRAWAELIEIELDQAYQQELYAELRERQLAELEALMPKPLPVLAPVAEQTIVSVETLTPVRKCYDEIFIEGVGVERIAC